MDARTWFLGVPLGDVLLFTAFVVPALVLRRRRRAHRALMLLATISMLKPALARLVFHNLQVSFPTFMLLMFALTDAFVVAAVLYDLRVHERVNAALRWGGALLVVLQPLLLMLDTTAPWLAVATPLR